MLIAWRRGREVACCMTNDGPVRVSRAQDAEDEQCVMLSIEDDRDGMSTSLMASGAMVRMSPATAVLLAAALTAGAEAARGRR